MPDYDSIKIITDNNLCISCGSCTHICPFDNIVMEFNTPRGKWDAIVQNTDACLQCNGSKNCLYVCPSYDTDYTKYGSEENNLLGKIENVYNGWSKDNNTRITSSSGGFIRDFSDMLLEKKIVTHIITITQDSGLEYTPKSIIDTKLMPNSIYHNINFENAFEILKNNEGKFLLIGLPCQLTGIELLLSKKKYVHLRDKVFLKVSLICGYTFDRTNMDFFADANAFNMEEISYRENGRYRKTRLSNSSDSVMFDVFNPTSINEKINNMLMFDIWLPQDNCLMCVDHIGYCADLVVGDAWQNKYDADRIGTNIILARTKKAKECLDLLDNFVFEEGDKEEIEASQGKYAKPMSGIANAQENLTKKKFVPNHKVSANVELYNQKTALKDKIKVKYIKRMLNSKQYRLAKLLYIVIEYKVLIKTIIKKMIFGKI